jgi:hypothetical protein
MAENNSNASRLYSCLGFFWALLVQGAKHHFLFDVAHHLRAHIDLLLLVRRFEGRDDLVLQYRSIAGFFLLDPGVDREHRSKIALDGLRQSGHVPLFFGNAGRHVLIHQLRNHILANAFDRLGNVFRSHQIGSLLIDHAALIVGDVVVFEQLFARIEVVLLHTPLRALDLPRQHAALDGLARFHADPGHQRLHAGRVAEDPHQVIFKREIKPARTRIALAPGAAAQLIVDAPRLMALGADDVQAAGGEHLLVPLLPLIVDVLELELVGIRDGVDLRLLTAA